MKNSHLFQAVAGFCWLVAGFATFCAAAEKPPFELREGDHVVFLGNRLIERAQDYGYLEAALFSRWPGRRITFQNLGWSGDTVRGTARAAFGTYEDNRDSGWPQHHERYGIPMLRRQLEVAQPTVLFVAYGANAAYTDQEASQFPADLNRLLDELDQTGARIVLISPTRHQRPRPTLPDPAQRNRRLHTITGVLRQVAQDRGYRFVDLFAGLSGPAEEPLSTENGIHLSREGYRQMARGVVEQLGLARTVWKLHVTADGKVVDAIGTPCKQPILTEKGLTFEVGDALLAMDGDQRDRSRVLRINLKDTDGDGRADRRRTVLSGFGNTDTHHMIHTLRWGPGGHLYFNQSVYIDSHVETPWGVRRLTAGGIWQFRPETARLEVYSRGLCNPWGHAFDRWGQSFATDGAGSGNIYWEFPGAVHEYAHQVDRVLPRPGPARPKACGLEIASGRHLPESFRGTFITTDYRVNRVICFQLTEKAGGYVEKPLPDLLSSNRTTFIPVDIKMGPDGAIYIVDFYEPVIGHGVVDFQHPLRDHAHGRIWRITAKGRPLVTPPKLAGALVEAVLEALKLPEDWTREQARRLLRERGAPLVVPALRKWLASLDPNDPDYEHHRLEALWVFQGVRHVEVDLLHRLLASTDHRVRAAAVRVLSCWHEHVPNAMSLLAAAVADEHSRVRLEGVCALWQIQSSESARVAMRVLDKPMDVYTDFIAWWAARQLEGHWMPQLRSGNPVFDEPEHLAFALAAINKPEALEPLVDLYRQGKIAAGNQHRVLRVIAALGGRPELQIVLDRATANAPAKPFGATVLLSVLERHAHRTEARPERLQDLVALLDASDERVRLAAALLGRWRVEAARRRLVALAADRETSSVLRQAAARALAHFGGPEIEKQLETLAATDQPIEVRAAAVAAWARVDAARAAVSTVEVLRHMPADGDAAPLFEAFIGRKEGAASLVRALAGKRLSSQVVAKGVHLARSSGREMPELVQALTSAGSLKPLPPELTAEARRKLPADVGRLGNAERGEEIYRRPALNCITCHAISGSGGQTGPDLATIGTTATLDEIVQSLLEPSAKIKQNYETANVLTVDGLIVSGVVRRQSDSEIVLLDSNAKTRVIPAGQIDEVYLSKTSLMPDELTALLRRDELVDLIRFMSELGKGPYRATTEPVVRTWSVLKPSEPLGRRLRSSVEALLAENVEQSNWLPAYSKVAGELPLSDLPRFANDRLSAGRFQIEVTTAGSVGLQFEDSAGLRVRVDGSPLDAGHRVTTKLSEGRHNVTVMVDRAKRTTPLGVSLYDVPESPGQARPVNGEAVGRVAAM